MKSALPPDFAMKLLDKEIELEASCTLLTLIELVDLYRLGIEYYEELKNHKSIDLQGRLQKILMRPSVLILMKAENEKYKSTHSALRARQRSQTCSAPMLNMQEKRQHFEISKKEMNHKLEDSGSLQIANKNKSAVKTVENQIEKAQDSSIKAVEDLKNQEMQLEERVKQRKKKKKLDISIESNGSTCSQQLKLQKFYAPASPLGSNICESSTNSSFFFEFSEEKSEQNLTLMKAEELEQIIEKIMEDNYMEKSEKITEIKVRYETQINEYLGKGGVFDELIRQMRENMTDEINSATLEIDAKRRDAIFQAKNQFAEMFE